ncbi:ADP-ribosylation factor-binding protein GGA3-like [Scomber japonicus]|uniref:ADP-ribosylation factor-binding protein GGA3-like n=1 Tax=Scomber japonicus TaxID=13676 RepID=UPI002306C2F8|nr:ADP-ribosylation factor-binding protein GGA3-like [Scomber japonicus]
MAATGTGRTSQSEILIDLVGLDVQSPSPPEQQPPTSSMSIPADLLCGTAATEPQSSSTNAPSTALSLLDEELLSLGLNEPAPVSSKSTAPTHVNLSNHFQPIQDSSKDLDLFDTTSPPAPAFSTSSFFPCTLSATVTSVSPTKSSTTASALSFSGAMFSTPSVSTQSVSGTSQSQQLVSSGLTITAPAALPQSYSSVLSVPSATAVTQQQASAAAVPFLSSSPSFNNNLQDLALLDVSSPKNTPGVMDFGSLLAKCEDLHAPFTLLSSLGGTSTASQPSLIGGIPGGSTIPPVKCQADDSPLLRSLSPILPLSQPNPGSGEEVSLANVFVPLDAIKPSKVCPVTAYDKNGVRLLLHFATDCPPGRPDVVVMVASMLNTAPLPVRNIVLQAAVPKTMKVRLQSPSGTELAPFNPILPPAAITQVMLLANPLKETVRMRYKLTFTLGEQPHTEVREVNDFPPADRWGAL